MFLQKRIRSSPKLLREFAARRREAAEAFAEDAKRHSSNAEMWERQGKKMKARQERSLAAVKQRSSEAAIEAAVSCEERANRIEIESNPKEAAE